MKRFLAAFLVLSTMFLFGCGKNETGTGTTAPPPTETTTTGIPTATVTFPEGFNVVQIAERLEENGVCSAQDFIALTNDADYVSSLGYAFTDFIPDSQRAFLLEGYLFPDTYEFYLNDSPENVLKKILRNTSAKLTGEYSLRAQKLGYTLDEIISLAAIIQEESYSEESMKLISSVLYNRLKSGTKLECDVTIKYLENYVVKSLYLKKLIEEEKGREITEEELLAETDKYRALYNVFKCPAIPEGPITCPGKAAIEAALYPAESDYFFFVTDEEKNFYFNETWEGHVKKCKELGLM
ncbi:MAG: endolytic transglycosylase MltG [Ruminococcaceae bacterium]|nr:endolytic transglycosylase MltG [Oscillospiraceae bacterium]